MKEERKIFGVARKIPGNGKKSERLEGSRGSVDRGVISKRLESRAAREAEALSLCGASEEVRTVGRKFCGMTGFLDDESRLVSE